MGSRRGPRWPTWSQARLLAPRPPARALCACHPAADAEPPRDRAGRPLELQRIGHSREHVGWDPLFEGVHDRMHRPSGVFSGRIRAGLLHRLHQGLELGLDRSALLGEQVAHREVELELASIALLVVDDALQYPQQATPHHVRRTEAPYAPGGLCGAALTCARPCTYHGATWTVTRHGGFPL